MKKKLFYLFALICSVSLFTACSDDDDASNPLLEKVNSTYEGTALTLKYSGAPMTGKSVIFNSQDGENATITLSGAAVSFTRTSSTLGLMNPGVIPGEATTVLNVKLVSEADGFSFNGTDKKEGYTIKYNGSVKEGVMNLDLQVEMAANELVGTTWNLQAYNGHDQTRTELPIRLDWNTTTKFNTKLMGIIPMQMTPGDVLYVMSGVGMIPVGSENYSVQEVMNKLLQSITFQKDGNIVASFSEKENLANPIWKQSPLNMAQYAVKNGKLFIYLNVDAIMNIMLAPKSKAAGFNPQSILTILLPKMLELIPMLSQGIPVDYEITEDNRLLVNLQKDFLFGFVEALYPLFQNQDFIDFVTAQIDAKPEMASNKSMIMDILNQFTTVVPTTTDMKIGLNFSKPVAQ